MNAIMLLSIQRSTMALYFAKQSLKLYFRNLNFCPTLTIVVMIHCNEWAPLPAIFGTYDVCPREKYFVSLTSASQIQFHALSTCEIHCEILVSSRIRMTLAACI